MISAFANIWKVPELRDRILFTLVLMVVIVRLGVAITLPGRGCRGDRRMAAGPRQESSDSRQRRGLQVMLNVFSGGALQQCGRLRTGDHAVHLGLDHDAAHDGGRATARQALPRGGRSSEDHPVHPSSSPSSSRWCRDSFWPRRCRIPRAIPYMEGIENQSTSRWSRWVADRVHPSHGPHHPLRHHAADVDRGPDHRAGDRKRGLADHFGEHHRGSPGVADPGLEDLRDGRMQRRPIPSSR